MIKDGKYGKLTIVVPLLVEKHRLLAKEAGVVLLDEKVDSDFIDLTSKIPYGLTAKVFRSGRVFSLYFMLWFYYLLVTDKL